MIRISRGFLKSSILYTVAGALPMASAILLLPFYLTYLSTENFGAQSVYLAFSVLIQILTTYSFDTSLYLYFHEYKNDAEKLKTFISSAFVFIAIIGSLISLFFVITGDWLFHIFFSNRGLSFYPYGMMAVITGVFQSAFKLNSSLLQSSERPDMYFWSNLLSFSLTAGFTVAGLEMYSDSLIGPVGGRMLAAVISGGWAFARIVATYGTHFNFSLLRTTFGFNNSSFVYQLQQWSMNYFDRFIMVFFLSLSVIGVYDFAVKCMLAIDFVISGLYNAFYPKVLGMIMRQPEKQSTTEINRYYHGFTAVVMVLVCLAIPFFVGIMDAIPFFATMFDKNPIRQGYEASRSYFPFIGMLYLVRIVRYYFASPYGALKFSKPLPVIYLIVSAVKVVLILAFIRRYEVYAVIGAALVSVLLEIVLLWLFIKARFRYKFNVTKLVAAPFMLAAVIGLMEASGFFHPYIQYGFYLIFCFVVLAWLYRAEIQMMTKGGLFK